MNIHDIAALVSLACAIYLIIIGASDLIAEKIGKILTDRLDREQHVSKQGIEISTTPDEDKELYDYFELNQDAPYRLTSTRNLSVKQVAAIWFGTAGYALWPMVIGAIKDSNNCKDLVRRGLEENTKYKSDDSLKPNNWYDDFKEKYKNDIVNEYHSEDY